MNMFDAVLSAIAQLYTNAASREFSQAADSSFVADYENAANHVTRAADLIYYRDHEVLDMPYDDEWAQLWKK